MSTGGMRRGPELPYKVLAGVVPMRDGWLVAAGKLVGTALYAEDPTVIATLRDVLDRVPAFTIIALAAPVGLPDDAAEGRRACDREARTLVGWPRRGTVLAAPCRAVLDATDFETARAANGGHLSATCWELLPRITEIAAEVQPYRQRTVYEVCPDLSLYQLNGNQPMARRKRTAAGQLQRRTLLAASFPGAERILDAEVPGVRSFYLTDACAALWTARRITAHAAIRLPQDPQWSKDGLRMEIVS
jgi:predicted RNase H-like nuclease